LSFAGLATKFSDNAEPWILKLPPTKKLQPTRPVVKLRGSGASSQSVRGVPRKEILAAFVSRVALETTEEDLATFLTESGMRGIVCEKLKNKDCVKFKTAAFFVSCCVESRDLFYDEANWPEGIEMCVWVYKD